MGGTQEEGEEAVRGGRGRTGLLEEGVGGKEGGRDARGGGRGC